MTPLVVYPNVPYNTFLDGTTATVAISDSLDHRLWDSLSSEDRHRWLLLTGKAMLSFEGLNPAPPTDSCLAEAQAELVLHWLSNNRTAALPKPEQQVRIKEFDFLKEEFFKSVGAEGFRVDVIPNSVLKCLEANGAYIPRRSSGGVGVIPRYR